MNGGDMNLEDVLTFVRNARPELWSLLIREMQLTSGRRNIEAAKRSQLGDHVQFDGFREAIPASVIRTRSGRILIKFQPTPEFPEGLLSLPASSLKRIA